MSKGVPAATPGKIRLQGSLFVPVFQCSKCHYTALRKDYMVKHLTIKSCADAEMVSETIEMVPKSSSTGGSTTATTATGDGNTTTATRDGNAVATGDGNTTSTTTGNTTTTGDGNNNNNGNTTIVLLAGTSDYKDRFREVLEKNDTLIRALTQCSLGAVPATAFRYLRGDKAPPELRNVMRTRDGRILEKTAQGDTVTARTKFERKNMEDILQEVEAVNPDDTTRPDEWRTLQADLARRNITGRGDQSFNASEVVGMVVEGSHRDLQGLSRRGHAVAHAAKRTFGLAVNDLPIVPEVT